MILGGQERINWSSVISYGKNLFEIREILDTSTIRERINLVCRGTVAPRSDIMVDNRYKVQGTGKNRLCSVNRLLEALLNKLTTSSHQSCRPSEEQAVVQTKK